ncbi:hypothetical protein HKD37_10G028212 [Glycine soja]
MEVKVKGQWIPFDSAALNFFLETPVVIEEGESLPAYARFVLLRPNQQELAACLCIPGKGFELNLNGLPLKILRKNLTTLAQTWSVFSFSNLAPTSHTSDTNLDRAKLKAVPSGGSNPARLGELGGKHLPYFAINRGGSDVSDLLDYSEPSSRVFLFENILLLVVPTAAICSSKGMIPLETIKRDMTTLGVSMGTNQTGKRFYQVKVKSLDTTSIKELGRLMEPLQMQAFRKTYGKILELTIAEVSIEAIASLTQYYDQPLRCFTFRDFQLKTIPFLRVSPLFEQNCNCGQGFSKRFGPHKTDSKRHSGPTTEVPRRQGKGYGQSRRLGPVYGSVSFANFWGRPLSKRGWFEQMASMMEAILGMRHLMEKNVATTAAVSSAAEADPTLLATAHHPPSNIVGRGRDTLGHNGNPHLGYNRAAYPYGLPPNYSPPVLQDDAGHIASPVLEREPPQQPDEVHKDPEDYARRDVEFYPPIPEGPAPSTLPQPNIATQPILVGYMSSSFADLVFAGERIEVGLKRGNSFFHGLFLNGWRLLSPIFLCLPLHLHGGKSPLKDPIEAQRSSLHRSPTSKLPSGQQGQKGRKEMAMPSLQRPRGSNPRRHLMYAQHHPSFSAHTGNASSSAPVQPKAPTQREAPQVPTPNTTRPAGNSNATRNFPPRPFQEFTPLPMMYEDLLPSLIANHLAVVTPGKVLQPPFPKWYDPNATCKYHGGVPRHSVEKCLALKYKVQHLMDVGWLTFQEDRPNVRTNPLANHGGGAINAVESNRPRKSKPLRDVATPRRFIFEALQKGGVIPHSGCKEDSCLLHSGKLHDMETCFGVEELLQQMIDQGRLEVGNEGREEQLICIGVARPKPLVIYFTKGTASQKPGHPLAAKPIPFPYQNSHAVPWRYTPPRGKEEEATDISSLSAKVTNITGLSDGEAPHASNKDIPVKGLPEKKDGKKEVSLEEASEFLRIIQQSEFKVIEQLNKTPAGVSLLELLMSSEPHRALLVKVLNEAHADIKRSIAGRKSGGQSSRLRQESEGSPPCHISRSFISAGLGDEGQVVAIYEDDVPSTLDLVRPCPPDFQLGNWRVEERPGIYATSIIIAFLGKTNFPNEMAPRKLASKRSRKDKAAEGTSSAPEYDSHRFRSAIHQQRFEAIKGWSFLRERRVQLRDDEYTDFQEEIGRRRWASLVTPMAKFDPDIVLEFYANAWPTEKGVRDMRSRVRGQWIPFDADAIGQLLGYSLVLEEGQECEYGQRRNRSNGFDEEAIAQLLCIPGQDFARTAAGRRVRIMRTNMTTLTQIWMTLLLSNILPTDHNSDLPLPKSSMWLSMAPTRHPLDPDKSNRALGFPALITGLCQSFGVPVAPTKVIRLPITRAFIEKYCTQRQAQGDAPQAAGAPPPPHQAGQAGSFDMEQYLRHLVRQQAANHRAHVQTHDCLSGQRSHGPGIGPRPKQERRPQKLPAMERRPTRTRRWPICLTSWEGVELHDWEIPRFIGENTKTFLSLTSYPELRRSEFLIGGYVGARASLLSTTPPFVAMTQELVTCGDTLQLSAPRHSVTPSVIDEQRPMWSSAPFPEMSASSSGDFFKSHKLSRTTSKSLAFIGRPTRSVILTLRSCDMRRQNLVIPHPFAIQTQSCPMARRDKLWSFCTLLSSRGGGPDDMRRQNLVIPHPFAIQTQSCPMARRDKLWSFCTLLSSRGGGPNDMRRQNLVIPHPFAIQTQSCPMARRDKLWSFCTLLSSRGGGPDDMRRQNLVIPHPFAIQTQSCPMARRDKLWSFCTLLSSRGGGPDDMRRQNLVIPHPFAIQTQSCPMARKDKLWSFCTLLSSRGGGPDDMRRQNLVIPHPFAIQTQSCPMARRDKLWSFCTLLSSRGGGPDDMRRQNLVIPHPFAIQTQSCPMARRDKLWSFCTLLSSRGGGPDDMRRQNLVIPHPFAIQTQSCPMARRDKLWSFCTLLSSRGGGPDDMRRQNLVIPHPFAIQTQSCPMERRDKLWSFCTLLSSRGGGPNDMRRQNLVIPHPFSIQTQSCPMARRDKLWSFCTLLSSRGGGPNDMRRQNLVIPHPFAIQTQSCPWHVETNYGHSAPFCHPEAAGPMTCGDKIWSFRTPLPFRHSRVDGTQRQIMAAGPMTCGDKIWSFRTPLPFRHSRVRWHAETNYGHSAPFVIERRRAR